MRDLFFYGSWYFSSLYIEAMYKVLIEITVDTYPNFVKFGNGDASALGFN
jgi:hypothetical protein